MHLYENPSVELPCKELSTEIISLESSLAEQGYILLLPSQGLNDYNYRLTQKGLHYFQFSLSTLMSFLLKSILVPIAVAFITALLVSA